MIRNSENTHLQLPNVWFRNETQQKQGSKAETRISRTERRKEKDDKECREMERELFKKSKGEAEHGPAKFLSSFKGTGKEKEKIVIKWKEKILRSVENEFGKWRKREWNYSRFDSFHLLKANYVAIYVFTGKHCFDVSPPHWISVTHCWQGLSS